jgi:hypothetical protein
MTPRGLFGQLCVSLAGRRAERFSGLERSWKWRREMDAAHEAGHAYLNFLEGGEIIELSIFESPHAAGFCRCGPQGANSEPGIVLYGPRLPGPVLSDRKRVVKALRLLALLAGGPTLFRAARAWLRFAESEVDFRLSFGWSGIIALRRELLQYGYLPGVRVNEILAATTNAGPISAYVRERHGKPTFEEYLAKIRSDPATQWGRVPVRSAGIAGNAAGRLLR